VCAIIICVTAWALDVEQTKQSPQPAACLLQLALVACYIHVVGCLHGLLEID